MPGTIFHFQPCLSPDPIATKPGIVPAFPRARTNPINCPPGKWPVGQTAAAAFPAAPTVRLQPGRLPRLQYQIRNHRPLKCDPAAHSNVVQYRECCPDAV